MRILSAKSQLTNARGFSFAEAIAAAAILIIVVGVSTSYMLKGDKQKTMALDDNCMKIASALMEHLSEQGLVSRPLDLVSSPLSIGVNPTWQRTLSPSEVISGITAAHQIPNLTNARLVDANNPPGLRSAQLHQGVISIIQAIYNYSGSYCSLAQGAPYEADASNPLIPSATSNLPWLGKLTGQREVTNTNASIRIQTYNIINGTVDQCLSRPLFLQPLGITEPPQALAQGLVSRPANIYNDRGFLVTVNVGYASKTDDQEQPGDINKETGGKVVVSATPRRSGTCSLSRKFQHQRKATPPAAPSLSIAPVTTNPAHNSCLAIANSANITLRFGYSTSDPESAGSMLWCRDRSVRMRPQPLPPASETQQRGIAAGDLRGPERCLTNTGSTGGLGTPSNGRVSNCFTDRVALASALPWSGEVAAGNASNFFYMPGDSDFALSGLSPINQWVPCDQLHVCQVNGVVTGGSERTGNLSIEKANGRIDYEMQFALGQHQAGCFVNIDVASVDTAYNMSAVSYGVIAQPLLENTTSPNTAYCFDRGMDLFSADTLYANCFVPSGAPYPALNPAATAGPVGKDLCPCAQDRFWYRNRCEDVNFDITLPGNTSYFSEDGTANALVRLACSNKIANSVYTGSGSGQNQCPYRCGIDFHDPNYPPQNNPGAGACVAVGNGYYSPNADDRRTACTNAKPGNSSYSGPGGGTNNCPWACDAGYVQSGNLCVPAGGTCPPSTNVIVAGPGANNIPLCQTACTTAGYAEPSVDYIPAPGPPNYWNCCCENLNTPTPTPGICAAGWSAEVLSSDEQVLADCQQIRTAVGRCAMGPGGSEGGTEANTNGGTLLCVSRITGTSPCTVYMRRCGWTPTPTPTPTPIPGVCAAGWSIEFLDTNEGQLLDCQNTRDNIGSCAPAPGGSQGGTVASSANRADLCVTRIAGNRPCKVYTRRCGCLANGQNTNDPDGNPNPGLCCSGYANASGICAIPATPTATPSLVSNACVCVGQQSVKDGLRCSLTGGRCAYVRNIFGAYTQGLCYEDTPSLVNCNFNPTAVPCNSSQADFRIDCEPRSGRWVQIGSCPSHSACASAQSLSAGEVNQSCYIGDKMKTINANNLYECR